MTAETIEMIKAVSRLESKFDAFLDKWEALPCKTVCKNDNRITDVERGTAWVRSMPIKVIGIVGIVITILFSAFAGAYAERLLNPANPQTITKDK